MTSILAACAGDHQSLLLQQSQSSNASYRANGTTSSWSSSDFSALLIDYKS
jgi:hypothetical protein